LLVAASQERRTARKWRVLAAAAVVVLITAGTVVGIAVSGNGHHNAPRPAAASRIATDPATGVNAAITTEPKGWGTAVRVQLTGVHEDETCSLVVVNKNGEREVAATWKVNYTGAVDVEGATAWAPANIASYDIVTDEGQRLVSVPA
jgi:hypothetical protein